MFLLLRKTGMVGIVGTDVQDFDEVCFQTRYDFLAIIGEAIPFPAIIRLERLFESNHLYECQTHT